MINDLWYKNAIIYCLSVSTFMDANGDGIGDFPGLMNRLDYLQGIGVTAIWLMPFQPSPFRDDGYDVADYYGVDPRYGTLGDFVEFTHGCKQRGIRVLIDLVVNHTSDKHPWFQEARSDPKSKYRDWYVWSKKKPKHASDGVVFPGVQKSTWNYDKLAKAWYFHRFYDFQPDLNTSNPESSGGNPEDHGLLDSAWRLGFPNGCRALRYRERRELTVRVPNRTIRHAANLPGVSFMATGRRHHPCGSQCLAENRYGILRHVRRTHADDVQLRGQSASVLRAGDK